jgi:glc operon protein GlcG
MITFVMLPRLLTRRAVVLSLSLALAAATHGVATAQDTPRVSLQDALSLIDAAQKEAAAKNFRLSFAVVDARGDVIALVRMPGAAAATTDTAIGKAMLSAIYGQPSAALVARQTSPVTQAMNDATGGRFRYLQGALPIVRGGFTVGAIAASGATSQQDEDSVRAALSSVILR